MMNPRLRMWPLLPVSALAVLALAFPGYAARVLNSADQFAVLSGSSVTATAPSPVDDTVGAGGNVVGPVLAATIIPNGGSPVPQALSDLAASRSQTASLGGIILGSELGGQTFAPGTYRVIGSANIAASSTVTLNGFGVYIFNIDTALTVGSSVDVLLAGGANAANVYWNVGTTTSISSDTDFAGIVMGGSDIVTGSAVTVFGKLQSVAGPITLGGTAIVDSVQEFAPAFDGTTPGDGSVFTVCVGDTLTYTVSGQDADGGFVTLSAAGKPLGASHLPNSGGEDTSGPLGDDFLGAGTSVSSRFNWVPQPEDVGSYTVVYSLTDTTGVISQNRVTINVSTRPAFIPPTPAEGTAVTLCPGQAYSYTVSATDPDSGDAGAVILEVDGEPAGMSHVLPLPLAGDGAVSSTASFTPTAGQAGSTFTVTYTVTDGQGCEATTTQTIRVDRVPVFEAPTPANNFQFTVCAGDTVNYQIRATDGDAADSVRITATGVPTGATHVDALPVVDNPAQTAFSWTPTVADAGVHVITYTATDNSPAACFSQTSVMINVLAPTPTTLTLTRTGTVAINSELCFTAVVRDQCARPMQGQTVYFRVDGTTGNDQLVSRTTDVNGAAQLCFTPTFPGTDTVLAWVELNGNTQRDPGEPMATENVTVMAPLSTIGGAVAGSGIVSALPITSVPGETGTFFVDGTVRRNGAAKGTVHFNVRLPNFLLRNTKLTSLTISENGEGRSAIIFGVTTAKGYGGRIRFRVDVLDAGTPGVPNDQFFLTLLTPSGPVTTGSNLRFLRYRQIGIQNDVVVRVGVPLR